MTFEWKGKTLRTYVDISSALSALVSKEEAREFMHAYREVSPYAYQNVGYLTGYMDTQTADRLMDWCETSHPIFGRSHPTPEEALTAGMKMAQGMRARE